MKMRMRSRFRVLGACAAALSLLSLCTGALCTGALCTGALCTGAAADEISVYSYNLPPATKESGGKITGPAAQLVAELAKAADLPQEATPIPVARLLGTVEDGHAIGFPLARNSEREPHFKWILELYRDAFSFATLAPAAAIDSLDQARAVSAVGVNQAGAPKDLLTALGFTNLDIANSEAQNAAKLFAGNIPTWFSVRSAFRPIAQAGHFDTTKLVIGAPVQPIGGWLIGSKDLPDDIVRKLQTRFEAMKRSGEYQAIMKGVVE